MTGDEYKLRVLQSADESGPLTPAAPYQLVLDAEHAC